MSKEIPIHQYAQFILYAKGHYEQFRVDGTVWGDLRRIQANYCGIDEQFISNGDIVLLIVNAVEHTIQPIRLLEFLSEIDPKNVWKTWPNRVTNIVDIEYDFRTAVVGKCLSLLRFITVLDKDGKQIIKLGEADARILKPKKEKNNDGKISVP